MTDMPASKTTKRGSSKLTKVLFAAPQSFVLEGKDFSTSNKPAGLFPTSDSSSTETTEYGTNVRLKSSRTQIINRRHCPQFVKYRCSTQPTQREIIDYVEQAETGGLDVGAIVARKWGIQSNWRMPQLWGMIMMVRNTHINQREPWAPFLVKWLNNSTAEPAWGEDLLIIVPSMSDGLVRDLVETQMELIDDDGVIEDDTQWSHLSID